MHVEDYEKRLIDNYRSKIPLLELQKMYPVIDTERLGWALVFCIFISGFIK